jgi:2-polyprenyl-3-methyl-5-hydroxy-6-metoxy-1,4-benzoquinol methylase
MTHTEVLPGQVAGPGSRAPTCRFCGSALSNVVVDLASNDGYLLRHLVRRGVPVLGVEPARNVAEVATSRGVPTLTEFFGLELAERMVAAGRRADLVVANNVLAQVPDLNDFVAGMAALLAREAREGFGRLEHYLSWSRSQR